MEWMVCSLFLVVLGSPVTLTYPSPVTGQEETRQLVPQTQLDVQYVVPRPGRVLFSGGEVDGEVRLCREGPFGKEKMTVALRRVVGPPEKPKPKEPAQVEPKTKPTKPEVPESPGESR